ncbi:hypothetical protein LX36DRAFT_150785 [Colletotrichum falcatum]|nr:hypothetical protein LX36DRAFT_150785 [Colletotrichum falcatum]
MHSDRGGHLLMRGKKGTRDATPPPPSPAPRRNIGRRRVSTYYLGRTIPLLMVELGELQPPSPSVAVWIGSVGYLKGVCRYGVFGQNFTSLNPQANIQGGGDIICRCGIPYSGASGYERRAMASRCFSSTDRLGGRRGTIKRPDAPHPGDVARASLFSRPEVPQEKDSGSACRSCIANGIWIVSASSPAQRSGNPPPTSLSLPWEPPEEGGGWSRHGNAAGGGRRR